MKRYLGIDTSNYTSSVALYTPEESTMYMDKIPLPVEEGFLGLRQNDAVFNHVRNIPDLLKGIPISRDDKIRCVAASTKPRDEEDSYMPCFLVGKSIGSAVSTTQNIPFYECSHQTGHILAALYSAEQLELSKKEFLAFHLSGGTTEILHVEHSHNAAKLFDITILGETLDVNAGQIVDRVGKMLKIRFPAGMELEQLALNSKNSYMDAVSTRPSIKDGNCSLSGLENKCQKLLDENFRDEDVARFCLDSIARTVIEMSKIATTRFPSLPIIYAGGVMSNQIIKGHIESQIKDTETYFAHPIFSSDNAAGVAIYASLMDGEIYG